MEKQRPKIGIVYLAYYHNESHIDDMVSALKKVTYPKDRLELIIVTNPHDEKGLFARYIEETVVSLSEQELPRVTHLPQKTNLGFAGGNNKGVEQAKVYNCDYVFFHNNDGFVALNAFEPLVSAMEHDQKIGAAQSLMLLHPETDYVNSTGNSFHYLGFGFCNNYRAKHKDISFPPVSDISYASGAALLVRMNLIEEFGAWDHDFFLYHEDLEWAFRLRAAGYRIVLVKDSIFYHKYQFSRSIEKFYWMERNRFGVLLMFFKWKTLFALLPMLLVLEVGLWIFAYKGGWLDRHKDVYRYWIKKEHRALWLKKRKRIQALRTISDREMLRYSVPSIRFQEKEMANPLLTYIGNPLMSAYYWVVVKCLIWW